MKWHDKMNQMTTLYWFLIALVCSLFKWKHIHQICWHKPHSFIARWSVRKLQVKSFPCSPILVLKSLLLTFYSDYMRFNLFNHSSTFQIIITRLLMYPSFHIDSGATKLMFFIFLMHKILISLPAHDFPSAWSL